MVEAISFTEKRFVAFIDILGFRERLAFYEQKMTSYFVDITKFFNSNGVDFYVFSDNIFLVSERLTEENWKAELSKLIRVCSELLFNQTLKGIPLRGCLSWGRTTVTGNFEEQSEPFPPGKDKSIVYGDSLIDAYAFETKQDWLGIMISPSIFNPSGKKTEEKRKLLLSFFEERTYGLMTSGSVSKLKMLQSLCIDNDVFFHVAGLYPIPVKEEQPLMGYAILPRRRNYANKNRSLLDSINSDFENVNAMLGSLFMASPTPKIQRKYTNTINFLKESQKGLLFLNEHKKEFEAVPYKKYHDILADRGLFI